MQVAGLSWGLFGSGAGLDHQLELLGVGTKTIVTSLFHDAETLQILRNVFI